MGKRSPIVSRSPGWKPRAYSKRRARVIRVPRKPRPLLDAGIAAGTILIATLFAFAFAAVLSGRLQLSLHVAFPVMMGLFGLGFLIGGRRVVHRRLMAASLIALGLGGAALFYLSRDDFDLRPHRHSPPAAEVAAPRR